MIGLLTHPHRRRPHIDAKGSSLGFQTKLGQPDANGGEVTMIVVIESSSEVSFFNRTPRDALQYGRLWTMPKPPAPPISPARATQILNLTKLAPDFQQERLGT